MREGVTTLEVKSGYGLSEADEARSLRVARRLAQELPLTVRTTFLVDGDGTVTDIIAKVDTKNSASQILEIINKNNGWYG